MEKFLSWWWPPGVVVGKLMEAGGGFEVASLVAMWLEGPFKNCFGEEIEGRMKGPFSHHRGKKFRH